MIISGPSSPGKDIDVYLQPLIIELWETGMETYDDCSYQIFQLCAALLWTINDFPAYAMLSGWAQKEQRSAHLVIILHTLNISNIIVRCVTWVIWHSYLLIIHFEEIRNRLMVKKITDLHLILYQAQKYWKIFMDSVMFSERVKRGSVVTVRVHGKKDSFFLNWHTGT